MYIYLVTRDSYPSNGQTLVKIFHSEKEMVKWFEQSDSREEGCNIIQIEYKNIGKIYEIL